MYIYIYICKWWKLVEMNRIGGLLHCQVRLPKRYSINHINWCVFHKERKRERKKERKKEKKKERKKDRNKERKNEREREKAWEICKILENDETQIRWSHLLVKKM